MEIQRNQLKKKLNKAEKRVTLKGSRTSGFSFSGISFKYINSSNGTSNLFEICSSVSPS
jgi:hypothetical protein